MTKQYRFYFDAGTAVYQFGGNAIVSRRWRHGKRTIAGYSLIQAADKLVRSFGSDTKLNISAAYRKNGSEWMPLNLEALNHENSFTY